ncbi:UNVERIFIED_CONTAM: hypothetical protein LK11_08510 [Mumia flava]|uniref:hypothetical protein n=1 Tax=Mumia flava TaxID=1348852 RepID=UPI0005743FF8|nr:hypothetical protein [Mumia flava]
MGERPEVPQAWVRRLAAVLEPLPECRGEDAWVGYRWRVRTATVAHVFGGEDGLFRITFRAPADEVMAFERLGPPYFKADWGRDVVGMMLDDDAVWDEVAEALVDSYLVQAPPALARTVEPGSRG